MLGLWWLRPRGDHDRLINSTQRALHVLGVPPEMEGAGEKDLLLYKPDKSFLAVDSRPVLRAIKEESFTNFHIWIDTGE